MAKFNSGNFGTSYDFDTVTDFGNTATARAEAFGDFTFAEAFASVTEDHSSSSSFSGAADFDFFG